MNTRSWLVLAALLSYVLHLDKHMHWLIAHLGGWIYALLFGIVFAETGLVVRTHAYAIV